MDDAIKEFINNFFKKDIIFDKRKFCIWQIHDKDAHTTNNSNDTCVSNDANNVDSAIEHDEITIRPNSNSDGITDASNTAFNDGIDTS